MTDQNALIASIGLDHDFSWGRNSHVAVDWVALRREGALEESPEKGVEGVHSFGMCASMAVGRGYSGSWVDAAGHQLP